MKSQESPSFLDRRHFLKLSTMALGVRSLSNAYSQVYSDGGKLPIESGALKVRLGEPIMYPTKLHGDTWNTTWADDGHLYSAADDTLGSSAEPTNSNLAVYRLTGDSPQGLRAELVNPMVQFGKLGETDARDGAVWKASGLISVDGILYLAVYRQWEADVDRFYVFECWDSSILKSSDHGVTWSPMPSIGKSMFPGRNFSNPVFIQYGKDGQGGRDGGDSFVYALSSNGVWNNGSTMTLGRVPKKKIGRLDPSDWEFAYGYTDDYPNQGKYEERKSGLPLWRPRHDTARWIFSAPGRTGMSGAHYIAPLGLYIMPQWHYPNIRDYKHSRMELYQARSPWGPWSIFHTQDYEPQAYYTPVIPAKFISDDGLHFWIFAAGDFSPPGPNSAYTINMIQVTVEQNS